MATMSTLAGSNPAVTSAGTTGRPCRPRHVRPRSSSRSPIPVSTSTRPAGVSISTQLRAWRRGPSASLSSATSRPQRTRGTGPNSAPASERNVPAWTSATRIPAPRAPDQWPASWPATNPPSVPRRRVRPAAGREVTVERRRGGLALTLVLRPEPGAPVGPLDRAGHPEEADLADPHALVERDGQAPDVRQLEGEVALPARIDIAGRGVDQEAQPPKTALALEPGDEVVRQLHPLERLAQHELARVEDERLVAADGQELGQVRLRLPNVDVRVAVVAEDPKAPVQVEGDRAGLEVHRIVGRDPDAPGLELRPDVAVGQHAHGATPGPPSRWAKSESTSRFSVARSSKLW